MFQVQGLLEQLTAIHLMKILPVFKKLRVHYIIHNTVHLGHVWSESDPVQNSKLCVSKIPLNVTLQSGLFC